MKLVFDSVKLVSGRDVDSIKWKSIGYENSETLSEKFHQQNIKVKGKGKAEV